MFVFCGILVVKYEGMGAVFSSEGVKNDGLMMYLAPILLFDAVLEYCGCAVKYVVILLVRGFKYGLVTGAFGAFLLIAKMLRTMVQKM